MHTRFAAAKITTIRQHEAGVSLRCFSVHFNRHLRAEGISVLSHRAHEKPVVFGWRRIVSEDAKTIVKRGDDDVHIAISINIAESRAATHLNLSCEI